MKFKIKSTLTQYDVHWSKGYALNIVYKAKHLKTCISIALFVFFMKNNFFQGAAKKLINSQ